MASWDPRSRVVVVIALVVVYAAVSSASADGDPVRSFLTYLGFIAVMTGIAVGATLLFRGAASPGDHRATGLSRSQVIMTVALAAWTVYAALDAARANGAHVVAFIVEMFAGVVMIGAVALTVALARRHRAKSAC